MPNTKGTKHLKEEDYQRILTLYNDGKLSRQQIEQRTPYTIRQIRRVIATAAVKPKARSGRPREMSDQQVQELVSFIRASNHNRRMTFLELSLCLFEQVFSMYIIRNALRRLGYRRCIARSRPPITDSNRRKRLQWAQDHAHWTVDDWSRTLWSSTTWISGGHHRGQWVTRLPGEQWDETCIVEEHQRREGWPFWGCFSGSVKGPAVFWRKDMDSSTYREHTVPVIDGWLQLERSQGRHHLLIQDETPNHPAAAGAAADLQERGVEVLTLPLFSPDLNLGEPVWNWIKEYIEEKWGLEDKPSYDSLQPYVKDAWEAVPPEFLRSLVESMPRRCQAVINADGGHTTV